MNGKKSKKGNDEDEFNEEIEEDGVKFVLPAIYADDIKSKDKITWGGKIKSSKDLRTWIGPGGKAEKLQKIQELIEKKQLSPEEVFKARLFVIADNLKIGDAIVEEMSLLIIKIKGIRYRNASAFLLGYLILKENKKDIDKNKIEEVYDSFGKEENVGILDIIRYARYILTLLK